MAPVDLQARAARARSALAGRAMTARLPDVARTEASPMPLPLDGVGMRGIELPVWPDECGVRHPVHARADVEVDLPDPRVKGIHMSRLYRLLCDSAESERLGTASLEKLLRAMVGSHADCGSARARLVLSFELLCKRPALVTPGLHGWNAYPVRLEAAWRDGRFTLDAQVRVTYASTCPCSAALSRQLVADAFEARFAAHATVATADALAWLQDHATLATPHSQRSIADIQVRLPAGPPDLGLLRLIDQAEAALGTPVQAAVKRADEQAFARLNGQNLMYVEDAARKLQAALAGSFAVTRIDVRHLESLHPHDAFARVSNAFAGEVRP
jgi:GTP cyclohydrolase I